MQYAKLYIDGQHQTVHLPREFNFEGQQVGIRRVGQAVVLFPEDKAWNTLFDSLYEFSSDFMSERNQPIEQTRENIFE